MDRFLRGFILGFEGFLGVVFIYFAYRTKNKKTLWFKGALFGLAIFLSVYGIGTLYRLPLINIVPAKTAMAQTVNSSLYGILLGLGIYRWGKRRSDWDKEEKPKRRLIKFRLAPSPAKKIEEYEEKKIRLKKPKKLW